MVWFIIFCLQLVILFVVSHFIKQRLFITLYLATRNSKLVISLVSLLLYPGVVIHEFAHLIAAVILFVPVKDMTLVPKVVEGKIQGGSVVIQKVDVFRRTLVGIAPLFGGLAVLWLIIVYLLPTIPLICQDFQLPNSGWVDLPAHLPAQAGAGILRLPPVAQNDIFCSSEKLLITNYQLLITIFSLYLLFSISSTMYSSQKDLEALLYTLPIGIVGIVLLYIVGFQASWVVALMQRFETVFAYLSIVLLLVLTIQIVVYLLLLVYSTIIKPTRSG